jgi:transcription elongation factor Elf1
MRRKPYTTSGIKRAKCFRCGEPASQQWQVCADGNIFRAVCDACDIKLNEVVLKFMRDPDWKQKIGKYKDLFKE